MAYSSVTEVSIMLELATVPSGSDCVERWKRSVVDPSDLHTITMIASSYTPSALSYLPRPVVNLALLSGGALGRRGDR
jgi:hypothetical protein